MAKVSIVKGSTDITQYLFIHDSSSSTGAGLTGLVFNASGLVCYYVRQIAAASALTLATQTVTGAHSDGGFVEVDATNMPGLYRLDLSDAVCAVGVDSVVVMLKGATNMAPVMLEIQLTDFDLNSSSPTVDTISISGSTLAADNFEASALTVITGQAQTGTLSTTQMTTDLSEATDDHYIGRLVIFTSGALTGQATSITDYAGSNGLVTFDATTEAPANTDTFIII